MSVNLPKLSLDKDLDLRELQTTGSLLQINEIYDEYDITADEKETSRTLDFIGQPVTDFNELSQQMTPVDENSFVKKKVLEKGGGLPLNDGYTVNIVFSGYWENELQPFDSISFKKPMEVDLQDNGLLPGMNIAIKSMLVGEVSVFLFSHNVMYGEMGVPDRIKPKAQSVFYIKLIRSIITASLKPIKFSEPNMFSRVHKEVKMLYTSGLTLHKSANTPLAIQLFKKAIYMLHKCRLADEKEEQIQENLLKKIYLNLAVCYNKMKQPFKACTCCNELHRLGNLWNNGKALFHNAKALRMMGEFKEAERKLLAAMKLCPGKEEMKTELELLRRNRESLNQAKLVGEQIVENNKCGLTEHFKDQVGLLVKNFKDNPDMCKLLLPPGLSADEMSYVKKVCIEQNLFFTKLPQSLVGDMDLTQSDVKFEECYSKYVLDKEDLSLMDGTIED